MVIFSFTEGSAIGSSCVDMLQIWVICYNIIYTEHQSLRIFFTRPAIKWTTRETHLQDKIHIYIHILTYCFLTNVNAMSVYTCENEITSIFQYTTIIVSLFFWGLLVSIFLLDDFTAKY